MRCLTRSIDPTALARHPSSVREELRAILEAAHVAVIDEGALLMWEVVVNAVRHGSGPVDVTVGRPGEFCRVEVHDASTRDPSVRERDPNREGGHGLELVEAWSVRWGIDHDAGGKTIWFEVP